MVKEIQLTRGKVALINDEDYEYLNQWKWFAHTNQGYCYAWGHIKIDGQRKNVRMHRFLLNTPVGMVTDHINGDGLDNRRSNIRICTIAENTHNQRKQKRLTTSRFKGVSWHPVKGKWQAYISVNKKQNPLGLFDSEIDAAKTYDEAAKKLHGEFACLNFVGV